MTTQLRIRDAARHSALRLAFACACAALAGFTGAACSREEPGPSTKPEEGHEHEARAADEHADEVSLSPAAIEAEGLVLERAALHTLRPSLRVPARIAFNSARMAHVGSPVRGRVAELLADLGSEVQQGDALLVIDSPELGEAQSDYLQKWSAVLTASPAVDLARNAYERGKTLYEANQGLALTEVQRREAELRVAQGTQRAAETAQQAAGNRLLLLGMTSETIDLLRETGAIDPRYTVRAPLAGQVIEREVTLGELVNPDREALLVLADLSHLWVLADVPDGRLAEVRIGAAARVHLGASEDHWCEGTVAYISPEVDPATRTVRVRIEAKDRHPELRPGVFAQAEIERFEGDGEGHGDGHDPSDTHAPVLAVPQSALQLVEGSKSIFVAVPGEPGTFARRVVFTGKTVGGYVEIHSGLSAGEEVVVRGAFLLKAELGKASAEHQH